MNQEQCPDIKESWENYRAFLLRCWQEDVDGESQWRFTLVQMGEDGGKMGFACFQEVVDYLREELG